MGSMNWLGFSLAPHEEEDNHSHSLNPDATDHSFNNLSPSFPIFEALNTNNTHTPQDWNTKGFGSNSSEENYNKSQNLLLGSSCSSNQHQLQHPKLENFLGRHSFGGGTNNTASSMFPNCSLQLPAPDGGEGGGSPRNYNTSIGLSMIKTWLRNQPAPQSSSSVALPLLTSNVDNGESSSSDNKHQPNTSSTDNQGEGGAVVESAVPRKSIETFGQRTSIYRGVTRHRWTGRYEAHLWDNSCRREGQTRKGRQVYLGGYDKEEKAARSYDLAALKYWGTTTTTNFPISHYEKELEEMKHMTRQEYVASLRRKSSGFSRGASIYRGVTRHHQHGRWQARIGRVAGNKDLYLGTFGTQEEAAEAYDIAAIKFRGLNAVTNFDMCRYDVKSILESSTLPIGGAAKRLKEVEQVTLTVNNPQILSSSEEDHSMNLSHLSYGSQTYHGCPNSLAYHHPQPYSQIHNYPFGHNKLYCKLEQDSSDASQTFQLGSTHNFFQSNSGVQSYMSIGSASSIDINSSGSSSVIYGDSYGGGGGYMIPMATTDFNIANDGNQNQRSINGYADDDVKALRYQNGYISSDPYHARNLYYHSQQTSADSCNTNWVPTAIPTPRPINMVPCNGAPPFTLLHDQ